MLALFKEHQFDGVIHLAAESHVDRSIENPMEFIYTNVVGTVNLLNAARAIWKDNLEDKRPTQSLLCIQSLVRPFCARLLRYI